MSAKAVFRFILLACRYRVAYIDMDGCLLRSMRVPEHIPEEHRLSYWMDNLCVTPIVFRRLAMLYLLKCLGVRLYLWTNRSERHREVTYSALGRHIRLFKGVYFLAGRKGNLWRCGPCMDDQEKYVGAHPGDLLVKRL